MQPDAPRSLPPFRVRVDMARASDFARETDNADELVAVPIAYPAVWLSEPHVYAAIAEACAQADSFPVHESQSFDYEAHLRFDADYDLSVSMSREAAPPRLRIDARISRLDGAPVGRFETLLRLVARQGAPS
jgi:hypothetical protein